MVKKVNLEDAYTLNDPDDNVRLYSKWAATYDTDFAQNSDYILPNQVAKAVHAIKKTGRVLDLGAGTGLLAAELLKLGKYKVDATDISEDMLRTAAKRTYMSDVTTRIDALDGAYDICTSSGHLHPWSCWTLRS